jgi:hypothetical protein
MDPHILFWQPPPSPLDRHSLRFSSTPPSEPIWCAAPPPPTNHIELSDHVSDSLRSCIQTPLALQTSCAPAAATTTLRAATATIIHDFDTHSTNWSAVLAVHIDVLFARIVSHREWDDAMCWLLAAGVDSLPVSRYSVTELC